MIEIFLTIIILLLLSILGFLFYILKQINSIKETNSVINRQNTTNDNKELSNSINILQEILSKIEFKLQNSQSDKIFDYLRTIKELLSEKAIIKTSDTFQENKNIQSEKTETQSKISAEQDIIYEVLKIYGRLKTNEKMPGINFVFVSKKKVDYNNVNGAFSNPALIESEFPAGIIIEYHSEYYLFPTFESIYLHDDIKSFFEILNKEGRIVKIIKPSVLIKKSNGFYLHTKGKIL